MKVKSIRQAKDLAGKKVLLRVDFNVPVNDQGEILDDYKIVASLPTIRFLLRYKAKVITISHFGRPKGKKSKKYSLKPIVKKIERMLDKKVKFVSDCTGFKPGTAVAKMKAGEIILLENLRFHKAEVVNSLKFARELAELADIYVNDAFAVSHRKHASVVAIKTFLPSYAGLLIEDEIKNLSKVLKASKRLIIILGGAKIGSKLPLIKKFSRKSFKILVGGALANNFFAAHRLEVGRSLVDKKSISIAKKLKSKNILLPIDVVVSEKAKGTVRAKNVNKVNKSDIIWDIGPETIRLFANFIKKADTIIWNGPMGMFEQEKFKSGTLSVARVVAAYSGGKAFAVVGGGETIKALNMTKMEGYIDWISTGGGAMLQFLSGEKMPGLEGIVK